MEINHTNNENYFGVKSMIRVCSEIEKNLLRMTRFKVAHVFPVCSLSNSITPKEKLTPQFIRAI
jgi:hypothetical protein